MSAANEYDAGDLVSDVADVAVTAASGAAELVGDVLVGTTDVIEAAISSRRTPFTRAIAILITLGLVGAVVAYWRKRSADADRERAARS